MSHALTDQSNPSGSNRAGGGSPRRRPAWLLPLLGVLLVAALLLGLSQCGRDDATGPDAVDQAATGVDADPGAGSGAPADSGDDGSGGVDADPGTGSGLPGDSGDESPAAGTTTGDAQTSGAASGSSAGGSLTAGSTDLFAADSGLAGVAGQTATGTGVAVESVPSDEGFWVGSSPTQRVWVQLTGSGESPFQVVAGQSVSFTATVTAAEDGFAEQVGLDPAEGAGQLTQQGHYLAVDRASLRLEQ